MSTSSTIKRKQRSIVLAVGSLLIAVGVTVWRWPIKVETSVMPKAVAIKTEAVDELTTSTQSPSESTAEAVTDDQVRWLNELFAWLELQDDAESLTAAALVLFQADPLGQSKDKAVRRAIELLRRAMELAPTDPLPAWLGFALCETEHDCDPHEFEAALKIRDRQNAVGWLGELARAQDEATRSAILRELATKARMDMYIARMNTLMFNSVNAARVPPPVNATGNAPMSVGDRVSLLARHTFATLPLPSFQHVSDACPSSTPNVTACRRLAEAMRRSDVLLVNGIGLKLLERTTPADPLEAARLIEARRQLDWLMYHIGRLNIDEAYFMRLIVEYGNEMLAWQQILREFGIPLTPPPDWRRP